MIESRFDALKRVLYILKQKCFSNTKERLCLFKYKTFYISFHI
jgi:hypothetical protein